MRKGILGSLTALVASAGLALAQTGAPAAAPPQAGPAPPAQESPAAACPAVPDMPEAPYPGYPSHPPLVPEIPSRTTPENYPESTQAPYPEEGCFGWYGGAEYVHWWMKNAPLPPLVTTGPEGSRGLLGDPNTQVVIGEQTFAGQAENGGRFTLGTWLDKGTTVELGYFFVSEGSAAAVNSPGALVLSRPFFNVVTGMQDAEGFSVPGSVAGGVQVSQDSQLWGAEANYRQQLKTGPHFHLDGLAGMRFLDLNEGLTILENLQNLPTVPILGGISAQALDQFTTRNYIFAGQVGAEGEWDWGPVFVNARAKLGLGPSIQEVTIRGNTVNSVNPNTVVLGGFLALPTNIGKQSRTQFEVIPETGINLGAVIANRVRVSVGYNLMYLSAVARPGNQIDFGINPAQGLPGSFGTGMPAQPPRPAFTFQESDFWVQGLTVSVEFRY